MPLEDYTLERLEEALRNADKAGDTEAAKQIAAAYREKQQSSIPSRGEAATVYTDAKAAGDDELAARAREVLNHHQGNDYRSELKDRQAEQIGEMGGLEKAAVGAGRGFMDVGQGLSQLGQQAWTPNTAAGYTAEKTRELERFNPLQEDSPWTVGAGRVVGNMAAAPVPGAQGATVAGRLGTAAAGGALAGGAEFVPEGGSRLQNAAIGGAFGAGGQAAIGEPLQYAANKLKNASAGNLNVSDEVSDAIKFADAEGLPLYLDDVSKSKIVRQAGQQMDEIPLIGGGKSREAQNQAAKGAAEDLLAKFTPDQQLDDLAKTVTDSAKGRIQALKRVAGSKYKAAFDDLNQAGEFDLSGSKKYIAGLIQDEAAKGSRADGKLIRELQSIVEAPAGNFEHWHQIRSGILSDIRDASKSTAPGLGSRTQAVLDDAAGKIRDEMTQTANKVGGRGAAQWNDANKFYASTIGELKKGPLAKAIKSEDPERILNTLIGTGNGTGRDSAYAAQQLYNGLNKKGRDAVRYAMLEKAFNASTGADEIFSPARFAKTLEDYSERTKVFFQPEDKAFMDGLTKYMRLAQTSGDYGANIKTGQKAVGTLYAAGAGAGMVASIPATAGAGLGIYGLQKVFRTARGRSLMLALGRVTPESQQAADIMRQIANLAGRSGGTVAVDQQPQ